tara:strand:- start:44 stop:889 length:846 start_codon:yes stop_codon:yes gene_type:complete
MTSPTWVRCPVVIPWYGGKFELSKKLVPMLPSHERYFEVFAGGLSMFFRKNKCTWNVVNDLDNDVINLYISVVEEFEAFKEFVYWYPRSRALFLEIKDEIKQGKEIEMPDPRRAARYFYVIRTAFNKNPYGSFSKSPKKDWGTKLIEELKYSRSYFDGVTIENLDFRELLKRYPPRDVDLWYMDPPYVVAGERGDYYVHDFTDEDHKGILEVCDEIDAAGGKFMVSYDDRNRIRELFSNYNVGEVTTKYAGNLSKRNTVIKELVITNYTSPTYQESIFKEN